MPTKKTVIHYASVLPGTGKTEWALALMVKRLTARTHITIYAAPTLALLEEVYEKLCGLAGPDLSPRIRFVSATNESEDKVSVQIRHILNGGAAEIGTYVACRPGTVILCTHAAFLSLDHTFDSKGLPMLPRRSEVSVIFDEVHKCAASLVKFNLKATAAQGFFKNNIQYLETAEVVPQTNFPADSNFYKVAIQKLDTSKASILMASSKEDRSSKDALSKFVQRYASSSNELYISAQTNGKKANIILHVLNVPFTLFYGWQQVVLLSAFLETSQMFHLLKEKHWGAGNDYVQLINISHKVVDAVRVRQVEKRYRAATITYLSPDTSLSMNHLKHAIMIDSYGSKHSFDYDAFNDAYKASMPVRKFISPQLMVARVLPDLERAKRQKAKGVAPGFTPNELTLIRAKLLLTLPGLSRLTPLQWYAKQAEALSAAWYTQLNKKPRPLPITCNKGGVAGAPEFVKQLKELLPSKSWVPMPFKSHGLNTFIEDDTIAFLATLNPKPETKRLLEQLCPNYNSSLDNTLDQCVQSVSRCSIRNVYSKSRPLIIVSDQVLALKLHEHLRGLPTILHPSKILPDIKLRSPYMVRVDSTGAKRTKQYLASEKGKAQRVAIQQKTKDRYKTDEAYRAQHLKNVQEYKKRPEVVALAAYIAEHSKLARQTESLRIQLNRLRKKGDPRFEAETARYADLKAKFNAEKAELKAKFAATQSK